MKIPYLRKEEIRKNTLEVLKEYEKRRGKKTGFPIDSADVFDILFGLETIFDTNGVLNNIDKRIIGSLFPDGHPSPWGRDKQIVVNATKVGEDKIERTAVGRLRIRLCSFDPTVFNENFTGAHEGMGHYVHHFLKGITGEKMDRPIYCRTNDYSALEWQANFAAGELTQPFDKVKWILDGKKPPEVIDIDVYKNSYREFFGASQAMMETRLHSLGYRLINGKYPWASYSTMERKRSERLDKRLKASEEVRNLNERARSAFSGFWDFDFARFNFGNAFRFSDIGDFFGGKKK